MRHAHMVTLRLRSCARDAADFNLVTAEPEGSGPREKGDADQATTALERHHRGDESGYKWFKTSALFRRRSGEPAWGRVFYLSGEVNGTFVVDGVVATGFVRATDCWRQRL